MKIGILSLMMASSLAAQSNDWTKGDTYREIACTAVAVADWGQTLDIQKQRRLGAGCYEQNPLIGNDVSRGKVNLYFLASIGLHIVISRVLPRGWREGFQYVSLGWELGVDAHNAHFGFQVRF